jgi:hypothetical protein
MNTYDKLSIMVPQMHLYIIKHKFKMSHIKCRITTSPHMQTRILIK